MARVDWSEPDDPYMAPEGIYEGRIVECTERKSKAGDCYFNVRFDGSETGSFLCFDTIMLEGKGRGMGQRKLKALGFLDMRDEIQAAELVGKRVMLSIKHGEWNGKPRTEVDAYAEGFSCGYCPVDEYRGFDEEATAPKDFSNTGGAGDFGDTPF